MQLLDMIDSAFPQQAAPVTPVRAFYIGGDTPHPWTDDEVKAIRSEWGLPIWVNTFPDASPHVQAAEIIAWLTGHNWTRHTCVAVDTESIAMHNYLTTLDQLIGEAGWHLIDYESKVAEAVNPLTNGGRWLADWTDQRHLVPGSVATQYLPGEHSGNPWDESVIRSDVPLHQLNPLRRPPVPRYSVTAALPDLYQGTSGPEVRNLQGLLNAQGDQGAKALIIDGRFGPETAAALTAYQHGHVATFVPAHAGPHTWHALLTCQQLPK